MYYFSENKWVINNKLFDLKISKSKAVINKILNDNEAKQFTLIFNSLMGNFKKYKNQSTHDTNKNMIQVALNTQELILKLNGESTASNKKSLRKNLSNKVINKKLTRHAKILIFDNIWGLNNQLLLEFQSQWSTCGFKFDYKNNFASLDLDRTKYADSINTLVPVSHLEGFEILYNSAVNFISKHPNVKFLISNNKLITDDFLRLVSILFRRKGVKTVLLQHGGNYQTDPLGELTSIEQNLSDHWLGWSTKQIDSPIGVHAIYRRKQKKNIVYVPTTLWTVPVTDWCHPNGKKFSEHLEHQSIFFKNMDQNTRAAFRIKIESKDRGFDQDQYYAKYFPQKQIIRGGLGKEIQYSRLVICGYSGTVMYNTIASDIPTIMYWNRDLWRWDEEYNGVLEQLKQANIFFDDGLKLASFLEDKVDTVDAWWSSEKTKDAINLFKKKFRWHSDYANEIHSLKSWVIENAV